VSLKHFLKADFEDAEFYNALVEMTKDGDRGTAILGATFVESQLRELLILKMIKLNKHDKDYLFDGMAPLSHFSAKIRVGYAFGCFGPITRYDLDVLREIRNAFAHSKRVIRFDMPIVAKQVRKFKCIAEMRDEKNPRNLFILATKCLILHLSAKGAGHVGVTTLD
jgi:hypothetical protein